MLRIYLHNYLYLSIYLSLKQSGSQTDSQSKELVIKKDGRGKGWVRVAGRRGGGRTRERNVWRGGKEGGGKGKG